MVRGINKMRQLAVTDIGLLELVNVINNYHVLPSRGDRRRRPKPKGKKEPSLGNTSERSYGSA
jgi:hypothetical protein